MRLDPHNHRDPSLLRSLLFFPPESHQPVCGLGALEACAAHEGDGRFIASIKSHLAAPHLSGTEIHGRQVTLSQLVGCLLRRIREAIPDSVRIDRLNAGRPVRFSTIEAEDRLAENRLAAAYKIAGFPEPHFVPEPVAAAHSLGETVPRGVRVLVSDFGGGTLDFSLVVFEREQDLACRVLATHGIWLGGDAIDGLLMFRLFRDYFGGEVRYWNWDRTKLLPLPSAIFMRLSHWRNIWGLRQVAEELRSTIQWGVTDSAPVERLLFLTEDLITPVELFASIERAKVELSGAPAAEIRFRRGPVDIQRRLEVELFNELVEPEVLRFREALQETLRRAQVRGEDVELILSTGGSSQIPCFQRELRAILPNAELQAPDYFNSVAQGLARIH